jgi:multidrug resistance efflux pump
MKKVKNAVALIIVVVLFIAVCYITPVENNEHDYTAEAQVQAQINIDSKR